METGIEVTKEGDSEETEDMEEDAAGMITTGVDRQAETGTAGGPPAPGRTTGSGRPAPTAR